MVGTVPFGCGQCVPCRVNRRRLWSWRMFFESLCHDESAFLTLTYDERHLPPGGNLVPKDLQDWLKRFRRALEPRRLRFFAVGEYGDQTFRPHYHASLFGVGPWAQRLVEQTWGKGHVLLAEFNQTTAQYVAGYVVKKMTSVGDPRLVGRVPEFARMSLRPGIGAEAMKVIAEQLGTDAGLEEMMRRCGDVPSQLLVGRRKVPLGRYLRAKLREEVGMPAHVKQRITDAWSQERSLEVLALFKNSTAVDARSAVVEASLGRIQSVEARSKIRARRTL